MAKTLDDLQINEITIGNRRLPDGADLSAINNGGPFQFEALAVLCWLHDRRDHPATDLEEWRAKTVRECMDYLGATGDTPNDDTPDAEELDPTAPTP